MTALRFTVHDVVPEPYAVAPNLLARLRIEETTGAVVHAVGLRCQVLVEPTRRRYDDLEEQGLIDLFGGRDRWADTMRSFAWVHTSAMVPGFTGATDVDLVLPCTYDVEVASAKYFNALEGGEIPVTMMFSGTMFVAAEDRVHATPVAWDKEARFRLPVATWRELMAAYFGDSSWIRLRRDSFDALCRFRAVRALPSWEATVEALDLPAGEQRTVVRERV